MAVRASLTLGMSRTECCRNAAGMRERRSRRKVEDPFPPARRATRRRSPDNATGTSCGGMKHFPYKSPGRRQRYNTFLLRSEDLYIDLLR